MAIILIAIFCYNVSMEEKTIFEKIIAGEVPATKVYEDEHTLAFLDIAPNNIGHTLVIPKKHSRNLLVMEPEDVTSLALSVQKIAQAVKKATNADGINIHQNIEPAAGQVVFHTHIHVIPRFKGDGFTHWKGARGYAEGEADAVAQKIKESL